MAAGHYRVLGACFGEELLKSVTHFLQPITSASQVVRAGESECAHAGEGARARAHKVCACGDASGRLAGLPERREGGPGVERPGA